MNHHYQFGAVLAPACRQINIHLLGAIRTIGLVGEGFSRKARGTTFCFLFTGNKQSKEGNDNGILNSMHSSMKIRKSLEAFVKQVLGLQ